MQVSILWLSSRWCKRAQKGQCDSGAFLCLWPPLAFPFQLEGLPLPADSVLACFCVDKKSTVKFVLLIEKHVFLSSKLLILSVLFPYSKFLQLHYGKTICLASFFVTEKLFFWPVFKKYQLRQPSVQMNKVCMCVQACECLCVCASLRVPVCVHAFRYMMVCWVLWGRGSHATWLLILALRHGFRVT